MDKQVQIAVIRKLIAEADIDRALQEMTAFLEANPGYRRLRGDLLRAESRHRKIKRDEAQGLISFEQAQLGYNQVANQLVGLVETFEGEAPGEERRARRLLVPALLGGAALLALLVWLVFRPGVEAEEQGLGYGDCPRFEETSQFNILLLPFRSLSSGMAQTHVLLRDRFDFFGRQNKVPLNAQVISPAEAVIMDPNRYPPNFRDAERLGENCRAQLIIWGTEEQRDSVILNTRYKFLLPEGFAVNRVIVTENNTVEAVPFFTSIATEGAITEDIEYLIKLFFGIVAHETDRADAAIDALGNLRTKDSTAALLSGIILSDSHVRKGEWENAMSAYDQLLEVHPEYPLALNNRGMLNFKDGRYEDAVVDFSNRLKLDSTDLTALSARGEAYLRLEQLDKARKDLEQVRERRPDDPRVIQQMRLLDSKMLEKSRLLEQSRESTSQNPRDLNAWRAQANAALSLGDAATATQAAKRWMELAPNDTEAAKTFLEALTREGRVDQLRDILENEARRPTTVRRLLRQDTSLRGRLESVVRTQRN
jgi:tetratricopeptide (TPR) repeat protein